VTYKIIENKKPVLNSYSWLSFQNRLRTTKDPTVVSKKLVTVDLKP
jgi:hypothetical protein